MLTPSVDNAAATKRRWSPDELIPFGKYILLNKINSGATAAVYRGKIRGEAGFERLVAVKRILPHMAGDPEFVHTFVREAKTAARLNHTNICPIYELGKVGESLYMAMEWVAGKDLGAITRRLHRADETMPSVVAAWIAKCLCDALDHAHTLKDARGKPAGIIHRDLSPTNIVISYEGQVKLIDFGLAKAGILAGDVWRNDKRSSAARDRPRENRPPERTPTRLSVGGDAASTSRLRGCRLRLALRA